MRMVPLVQIYLTADTALLFEKKGLTARLISVAPLKLLYHVISCDLLLCKFFMRTGQHPSGEGRMWYTKQLHLTVPERIVQDSGKGPSIRSVIKLCG